MESSKNERKRTDKLIGTGLQNHQTAVALGGRARLTGMNCERNAKKDFTPRGKSKQKPFRNPGHVFNPRPAEQKNVRSEGSQEKNKTNTEPPDPKNLVGRLWMGKKTTILGITRTSNDQERHGSPTGIHLEQTRCGDVYGK